MTDIPAPPGASSLMPAGEPNTAEMLDGTRVPLPPATPDQPAIGVLRQGAMGELQRLKGSEEFRKLLLAGDANALNEVKRLERIIKTPTGTFYGGVQTPAQVEQHAAGWDNYADIRGIYGDEIYADINSGTPITEAEHRQARSLINETENG